MADVRAPRVLTITAEFHVPEGLRRDVRAARVDAAIARITGVLEGLAATVFPWADRLVITHDWSYRWNRGTSTIELPPSGDNTVA